LNLKLAPATADEVLTEYTNKQTGAVLKLRPTAAFRARYASTDRAKAHDFGLQVLHLPEAEAFEVVP
jgi:hypothetical protein